MAGLPWIARALGATVARRSERIQSLWSGYGELFRVELEGGELRTAVVKWVKPPTRESGRAHLRKCRSYQVETAWYRDFAARCDEGCRVARLYASREAPDETVLVLEDLDAAGFSDRHRRPAPEVLDRVLAWLAAFHARFLAVEPKGLWPVGSYWHLDTRPDELALVDDARLREAAVWVDRELTACRFRTLIHGDAKLANFCFAEPGGSVAAVDFQYVGGGAGVKDVAYLLSGEVEGEAEQRCLDFYFCKLRRRAADLRVPVDIDALEREWRALYPLASLDFYRFLAGWAKPSWQHDASMRARAGALLERLAR